MKAGSFDLGELSPYACPDCHGVLSEIREGGILRFRCHTGHAYSANSLFSSLTENTENVLWSAVRSLEETVLLLHHMAQHLKEAGKDDEAAAALKEANEAARKIEQVRSLAMAEETREGRKRMEA